MNMLARKHINEVNKDLLINCTEQMNSALPDEFLAGLPTARSARDHPGDHRSSS